MNYKLFKESLNKINIKNNDIVMAHIDLSNFFAEKSLLERCEILYEYLNKFFFAHGTILVPSFTYSFCKNGVFNLKKSPSEVGIFTEFFRRKKKIIRSNHPIFSFSTTGKYSKILTDNISNSSTGSGSIFEKLHSFKGKILFFGCRFITSCTFLHFIEQRYNVPYRYSKFFKMTKNNKEFEFYVRSIERLSFKKYKKKTQIEIDLLKAKILKSTKCKNTIISSCETDDLFKFVTSKLKKNIYYILDQKPSLIKKL
jgi:aminoglycoside 3-N-acetyltransferase